MANIVGNQFGGRWTEKKLEILKRYLDAYTTALKGKIFRLLYIDAFAGTGRVGQETPDPDQNDRRKFIDGSAKVASSIKDKPFDELIFIEKDEYKCLELETLKSDRPDRNIRIEKADANQYLRNLQRDWQRCRGVLFLDPFGAQVDWTTIEAIAGYKALDTWILFPTSTIIRMLPRSRIPDDISPKWASTLTRVYGDESTWRVIYQESMQTEMFDNERRLEREAGAEKLINIYKDRLKELFGDRFLDRSKTLKNSRNSPLYEFMFCVGSDRPAAIKLAKRIANHLLDL
ncbi:MAG: three-Cys-motif partner protein TcmP [Bacteroidetes bacterium]|nr:three-Cys-motif partner protein TcmP [Bacteroidota bacterium]